MFFAGSLLFIRMCFPEVIISQKGVKVTTRTAQLVPTTNFRSVLMEILTLDSAVRLFTFTIVLHLNRKPKKQYCSCRILFCHFTQLLLKAVNTCTVML